MSVKAASSPRPFRKCREAHHISEKNSDLSAFRSHPVLQTEKQTRVAYSREDKAKRYGLQSALFGRGARSDLKSNALNDGHNAGGYRFDL